MQILKKSLDISSGLFSTALIELSFVYNYGKKINFDFLPIVLNMEMQIFNIEDVFRHFIWPIFYNTYCNKFCI